MSEGAREFEEQLAHELGVVRQMLLAANLPHNVVEDGRATLGIAAARLRTLAADRERLDWLETNAAKIRRHSPTGRVSILVHASGDMLPGQPTFRDAIDAARALTDSKER